MLSQEAIHGGSMMLARALPVWEAAAISCCRFELLVRVIAGVDFPAESVRLNIAGDDGLLSLIFRGGSFDEREQTLLRRCARVRNKLLHCEPDALLRVLREIDPTFLPPREVKRVRFPSDASGTDIAAALADPSAAADVQDTVSRAEGFYGWMLEAARTGIFAKAVEVLERGIVLLNARRDPTTSAP